MLILYIVLAVVAIVAVLLIVCAVRANAIKANVESKSPTAPPTFNDEQLDAYAKSMSEMVKIPTIFKKDQDNTELFESYFVKLTELFPNVMANVERIPIKNAFLLHWKGVNPTGNALMLMSHSDVVEAPGKWSRPAFGGEIDGDTIWGRGTVDTKDTMCAMLHAVDELIAEGYAPKNDLYLASSWAEEVGGDGAPNIKKYFQENNIRIELSIDEGGNIQKAPYPGMAGEFGLINTMEKGYGDYKFIARSTGGHAMMGPPNTPIVRLARFVNDIDKHSPFKRKLTPEIADLFLEAAPYMSMKYRMFFANRWLFNPFLPGIIKKMGPNFDAMLRTTCAFTMASGSGAPNVIPVEASITANCRFVHHQSSEDVLRIFKERAAKYDIEVEVLRMNDCTPACEIKTGPYEFIKGCIGDVFAPVGVLPSIVLGGTDARHMVDVARASLRFTGFRPVEGQMSTPHGDNEFIKKHQLGELVFFDKYLIKKFNA